MSDKKSSSAKYKTFNTSGCLNKSTQRSHTSDKANCGQMSHINLLIYCGTQCLYYLDSCGTSFDSDVATMHVPFGKVNKTVRQS